jgi:hypothetical protein
LFFGFYRAFVSGVMLVLMTTSSTDERRETKPAKSQRDAHLSPAGKRRSFPKVPNLLQYVSTDIYFGRVKIDGKIFRESWKVVVFTDAKLLLGDWSMLGAHGAGWWLREVRVGGREALCRGDAAVT